MSYQSITLLTKAHPSSAMVRVLINNEIDKNEDKGLK